MPSTRSNSPELRRTSVDERRSAEPTQPPRRRRRLVTFVILFVVSLCVVGGALAIGIVNSHDALLAGRVEVAPRGDLEAAFFELPWNGKDTATVALLPDPTQAWLSRWELVQKAKQSIDVAYFILEGDIFGLSFLGALLDAAEQGVTVRVLVDGLATDMADTTHTLTGRNFLEVLATHPKIDVRVARPHLERVGSFLTNLEAGSLIASEHDKILNVDGKWTLTGGRNIGEDYFTSHLRPGRQFLDMDVLLTSSDVVARTQAAFERLYDSADTMDSTGFELSSRKTVEWAHERMRAWLEGRHLDLTADEDRRELDQEWQAALVARPEYWGALGEHRPGRAFSARVRVVDSPAREKPRAGEITQMVQQLVSVAKRDITLISPYLVLGESLTSALAEAAQRGVRVTVLTNSPQSSDNAISQALFLDQWPTLLARVPSMQLFVVGGEDTLHTKLMLFDQSVSLVGTYNLDPTAMQMNSELMVGLWSQPLNAHVRKEVEQSIARGAPAVYRYRIRLAEDGRAELDSRGGPQVEFGPEDHLTEEQMKTTRDAQRIIGGISQALGLEPLVRARPPGDAAARGADAGTVP